MRDLPRREIPFNRHPLGPGFAARAPQTARETRALPRSSAPAFGWKAAANADQTFATGNPDLRALVNEIKNTPGFTDGMGEAMDIFSGGGKPSPADIKPSIKAESQPGHVRVTGSKDHAELYKLFMRRVGTVNWILVADNRKKFPFDDQTPLIAPGVPEQREYRAIGVINDAEVGQFSDVVPVTFNG